MRKIFKLIFILLAILIIFLSIIYFTSNKNANKINSAQNIISQLVNKETTISFVGDMMLTRGVGASVKNNFENDFNKLFVNLEELKNADILFGNLEGPVSDIGNNVGSKYSFRMDPNILPALKNAGFDIVSFANNHVGDWNVAAFKDTLSRLKIIEILKTGAGDNKLDAIEPVIIKKNGIKFGFIGFSDVGPAWMEAKENNPGILLASDPNLTSIIQNAKTKCDVLIVSFHWGEEYKTTHNKRQEELAYKAIDSGADMIIGHHPHVIQDVGEYNGKPIVYSLGNFIFDQKFSKDTMRGMLFEATFKDKTLIKSEQKIIILNEQYQPEGIFTKEEARERDDLLSTICPRPGKEYADMFLLNIGQKIGLPDKTYIPSKLRELNVISSTKRGICLEKEARDSFEKMAEKAKDAGYTIKVSSGFRSYTYQKTLLDNAIKSGQKNASVAIAKPGYSEHQLGTALDITSKSINYTGASLVFADTEESKWLKENASDFGFIESYPYGKEEITGYMYEPWHYRYVGIKTAQEIKSSGLTTTEFLK